MTPLLLTTTLLVLSNVFMTLAWYGHLAGFKEKPIILAILASWGIAFFEYLLQVPANRIGHNHQYSMAHLKILQEVISLTVFVPVVVLILREPFKWDYVWASLCVLAAVFFIFRDRHPSPTLRTETSTPVLTAPADPNPP